MTRLALSEIEKLSLAVLEKHGFSRDHASALTHTMLSGERDGCATHGIYRLLVCIHTLKAGKVNPQAMPQIIDTAPGVVKVDAEGGFSQLAFERASLTCAKKLSQTASRSWQSITACTFQRCGWKLSS